MSQKNGLLWVKRHWQNRSEFNIFRRSSDGMSIIKAWKNWGSFYKRYLYFELQKVWRVHWPYTIVLNNPRLTHSLLKAQNGAKTPGLAKIARELHLKSLISWKAGLVV